MANKIISRVRVTCVSTCIMAVMPCARFCHYIILVHSVYVSASVWRPLCCGGSNVRSHYRSHSEKCIVNIYAQCIFDEEEESAVGSQEIGIVLGFR